MNSQVKNWRGRSRGERDEREERQRGERGESGVATGEREIEREGGREEPRRGER